jgi:hypothetical protein
VVVWERNGTAQGGWCGLHAYIQREGVRPHVLGRFGMWGREEGSGWLGEAVERMIGV